MPRIVARAADVIARVRTEVAAEGVADVDTEIAAIAKLVVDVDPRGKGELSQSEVRRLLAKDANAFVDGTRARARPLQRREDLVGRRQHRELRALARLSNRAAADRRATPS
jgi:hypothetical protein